MPSMLLLNMLIIGILLVILGIVMFIKKKKVLGLMFLMMGIMTAAVALSAMALHPDKSPF